MTIPVASDALGWVLQREGGAVLDRPERVEAYLCDLLVGRQREVNLLVQVVRCGAAVRLMRGAGSPGGMTTGQAVERMKEEYGTETVFAVWAVNTWVDALLTLTPWRVSTRPWASEPPVVQKVERAATKTALFVLYLARMAAAKGGHHEVAAEHVLLGIAEEGQCRGAQALVLLGIDLDALPGQVRFERPGGPPLVTPDAIDASNPRVKYWRPRLGSTAVSVLERASQEALDQGGNRPVSSEHLLIGVLHRGAAIHIRVPPLRRVNETAVRYAVRLLGTEA